MRGLVRTRRTGLATALALGLAFAYPLILCAALDIHIKFDGVKGESRDDGHPGEIDVEGFTWGQSMPEDESKAAGQTAVDRAIPGRLTITKRVDGASPQLAEIKAKGKTVPTAVIDAPRKDGKPGRTITTMRKVKIVSQTTSPDGRSEKVTLAYQVYRVDFTSR